MKINILRAVDQKSFISAGTFEKNIKNFSFKKFRIDYISIDKISKIFLDCYDADSNSPRFLNFFRKYDYFSPGFGAFLFIPFFLNSRNKNHLHTSLLFITHAPGGHIFEFYLMAKMLNNNDLIIAPTKSAADTIKYINPLLASNLYVINHPVEFLPEEKYALSKNRQNAEFYHDDYILALTRVHPDKLIHRSIEAIDLLRKKGKKIKLFIAGSLACTNSQSRTTYSQILKQKIKDLSLGNQIKFLGEIKNLKEKIFYLKNAKALINLSVTIEESFGKSIVEAINTGTPVIGTKWNGFTETIGKCGVLIPVTIKDGIADVFPEYISDAIEEIIENNKFYKEKCLKHKEKFKIKKIEHQYYKILKNKKTAGLIERGKNSESGLIDKISIIKGFGYGEIFELYLEYFKKNILSKDDKFTFGQIFHEILLLSVKRELNSFLAGKKNNDKCYEIRPEFKLERKAKFYYKLINSVFTCSTLYSKEISLLFCLNKTDVGYFGKILNTLKKKFNKSERLDYIEVEHEILKENYLGACNLWHKYFDSIAFKERDYIKIRQISKIYRKLKKHSKSIPLIKKWLKDYSCSQFSLPVWADLCFNSMESGKKFFNDADEAFEKVKLFSEDKIFIDKLQNKLIVLKMLQE